MLTPDRLEVLVFKTNSVPERHPNCSVDTVNIFDRVCTSCSNGCGQVQAVTPPTGAPSICKLTNISAGTVPAQRQPVKDYDAYNKWPAGYQKLRCIGDDKKPVTPPVTPVTPPAAPAPTTIFVPAPEPPEDRLLGMPPSTLYIVGGVLIGAIIALAVMISYCMCKKSVAAPLTITQTSFNHHLVHMQPRPGYPYPEPMQMHRPPFDTPNYNNDFDQD